MSARNPARAGWRITWTILSLVVVESLVCALSMSPIVAAWVSMSAVAADNRTLRVALVSLAVVPSYAAFALMLTIVTPAAIGLTGWRSPPAAEMRIAEVGWPILRWARFMALIHVARFFAGALLRGTPVWTLHLRLCGARLGRRVYINSLAVSDYNLLEMADDVVIGGAVHLAGHTVEAGVVKTGTVRLGRGVTIGLGSVVDIDVDIAAGCQIGAMSFVPKHTRITDPGVYVGIPVSRLEHHAHAG